MDAIFQIESAHIAIISSWKRWWGRFTGAPARIFMGKLLSRFPNASHSGITLIVLDPSLEKKSDIFFTRTSEALDIAAERAPNTYAALSRDIQQIVLRERERPTEPSYHRFQLAAVVTPDVALDADVVLYAVWLLYTSGLSRGELHAERRAEELLQTLEPTERIRATEWLHSKTNLSS